MTLETSSSKPSIAQLRISKEAFSDYTCAVKKLTFHWAIEMAKCRSTYALSKNLGSVPGIDMAPKNQA